MDDNDISKMEQEKREVAALFDRASSKYGQVGPRFFSHFGRRMVEIAGIQKGSNVLDVATGRGAVLFPAADAVGPHGHVLGIDLSESMVEETAREIARRAGPANAEVRRMDGEHLDLPDATFDHVLCGFALFFFPQLDQAMSEFRRVLKPGGQLCISLWDKLLEEQWSWYLDITKAYLPAEPDAAPAATTSSASEPVFDTPEGVRAILTNAGYRQAQVLSEAADFVYADEEEYWATLWSHGMREIPERIEETKGADGLEKFRAEVFRNLAQMKQSDGIHQLFPVLFGLATKADA